MIDSKANYTVVSVRPETKAEILALRSMFPDESLNGFVNHMVQFFKAGHCPECGANVTITKNCSCKAPERE